MGKELCFFIEGKELYLEQVLVDYNDIPIFFLCKDDKAYYLALCTEVEQLCYIVVGLSDADVYSLLHGNVTMRESITKQRKYWEIISGEQIESDIAVDRLMEEIDGFVLPEEGAYFEVLTDEIASYVKKFDASFWESGNFELIPQTLELNEDIFIEPGVCNNDCVEQFVELYDCLSRQKEEIGLEDGNVTYADDMDSIFCSRIEILVSDSSEEWKAIEINDLAFAA